MLVSIQNPDSAGDPQIKQLEAMLDKILDIQYPDRVKERLAAQNSNLPKDTLRYQVTNNRSFQATQFYSSGVSDSENAFWGLSSPTATSQNVNNQTFLAAVHDNQKIQDDQTVKLRLLQNVFIIKRM